MIATGTEIDVGVGQLWTPRFPRGDGVARAASLLPGIRDVAGATLAEGPRWEVVVSPGCLQVRTRDWSRRQRSDERAVQRRIKQLPPVSRGQRQITEWSRQSRANMVKVLCRLDYAPMLATPTRPPAMLTLTYPRGLANRCTVRCSSEGTSRSATQALPARLGSGLDRGVEA